MNAIALEPSQIFASPAPSVILQASVLPTQLRISAATIKLPPSSAASADINQFALTPDHLSGRCELHGEPRLLTSIPVIFAAEPAATRSFARLKAERFPHSWHAVFADSALPEDWLIGEPERLLARCCLSCRAAALQFYIGNRVRPASRRVRDRHKAHRPAALPLL